MARDSPPIGFRSHTYDRCWIPSKSIILPFILELYSHLSPFGSENVGSILYTRCDYTHYAQDGTQLVLTCKQVWRAKISAFREGVHSCVLTFDATNVPLDGAIVLSVPFSGTAVKHGYCQFQFHPSSMT